MRKIQFAILYLLIITVCGCSHWVDSTVPGINNPQTQKDIHELPIYISDWNSSGNPAGGMGLLGVFQGTLNVKELRGELVPLRSGSSTDTLEVVDITNFLEVAPCVDCVKLASIGLDTDGNPVVSIGVKHPFPAGDPMKPITGRNRADLHVFNIEGIVAFETSSTDSFPSIGKSIASNAGLVNADGYTGYLDPYLDEILPTAADIHPYRLHFKDYSQGNFDPSNPTGFASVTDPPPTGNLVMAMGCDYDFQDYVFNLSSGDTIKFIYSVGCTYALSAESKNKRFDPEYRISQHNKKAASEVHVRILTNNLKAGDVSSSAQLEISVLDINNGVPVGTALNQMEHDSSVAGIMAEIPGVTSGMVNTYTAAGGDGRDPVNPLKFNMTVTNALGASDGSYHGLVKVLDSYPVGQNQSTILNGKDGIKRANPLTNPTAGVFDIPEFATYTAFEISILSAPQNPIAIIKTTPDPPNVTTQYSKVTFDGSDSYDPDGGSITLFEWDFDWDGDPANFAPDVSGIVPIVDHYYLCEAGTFTAALRVTDDDTPPGVSQIASVEINVTDNFIPGTWMGTTILNSESIRGDDFYVTAKALAVESDNTVHIVTQDGRFIYHRTFDGVTVSPREIVPGPPVSVRMVDCIVDKNDELHVVWISGSGTGTMVQHTVTQNGSFTGGINILATSGVENPYYEDMCIAVNKDWDIMITWLGRDQYFDPYSYFEYVLDTGSGFSAADKIPFKANYGWGGGSSIMQSENLVATPDGKFHQIDRWRDVDQPGIVAIQDLVYNGTDWEPPRVAFISASIPNAFTDLAACADAQGDIHLTGRYHDGDNRTYWIRYDSENDTWLPPVKISDTSAPWSPVTDGLYGPMGDIEVSPSGMIHSVYVSLTDHILHLKVFCKLWDAATILATPDAAIDPLLIEQGLGHTDLMWDKEGNLCAVYQTSSSSPYTSGFNRLVY